MLKIENKFTFKRIKKNNLTPKTNMKSFFEENYFSRKENRTFILEPLSTDRKKYSVNSIIFTKKKNKEKTEKLKKHPTFFNNFLNSKQRNNSKRDSKLNLSICYLINLKKSRNFNKINIPLVSKTKTQLNIINNQTKPKKGFSFIELNKTTNLNMPQLLATTTIMNTLIIPPIKKQKQKQNINKQNNNLIQIKKIQTINQTKKQTTNFFKTTINNNNNNNKDIKNNTLTSPTNNINTKNIFKKIKTTIKPPDILELLIKQKQKM